MKTKKDKLNFEIFTEAIIMILLVLTMPIVYSKLTTISTEQIYNNEKQNDFLDNISTKVISFFDLIPTAKAQVFYGCCKGTLSGACRLTTDQASCNEMSDGIGEWASGKTCGETDFCKSGWCSNGESCGLNTPKWLCLNQGGTFIETESAANELCEKSCCGLNGSTAYITGQQCNLLGGIPEYVGGSTDFEKEINCMMEATKYPQGCCVSSIGSMGCQYTNSKACSGTLYSKFCSQVSDCDVQAHFSSTCYNGEIYYTDNLGNREDLKQNCTQSNLQCEKQVDGSGKCIDMSCKDLILPQDYSTGKKTTLQNMESICVYDQKVPSLFSNTYDESWGQTAVGSRHWVWRCINGKVEIEGCEDLRAGICAQIDIDESSAVFNYAKCIPSLADSCYLQQTKTNCLNPDKTGNQCYWFGDDQRITTDLNWLLQRTKDDEDSKDGGYAEPTMLEQMAGFKIANEEKEGTTSGACMPKYPKADSSSEFSKSLYGDSIIAVPQEKGEWADGWPCKDNCEVGGYDDDERNDGALEREQLWAQLMSRKCSAVGDAGIKTNLVGNITIGVSEKSQCFENDDDTGDCDGDRESETEIIPPRFIEMPGMHGKDIPTWVNTLYIEQESLITNNKIYSLENTNFDSQKDKFWSFNPTGYALTCVVCVSPIFTGLKTFYGAIKAITTATLSGGGQASIWGAGGFTGSIAMVAAAAIAAAALAYVIGLALGLSPSESLRLAKYAGAGAGIGMTLAIIVGASGPVGWIIAGAAAIVSGIIAVFTGKDNRLFSYSFDCIPYSPPAGSANCEKCNLDPLRPCSEYRCWSLGADCEFKGEFGAGSDDEIVDGEGQCMAGNLGDMFPPTISKITPLTTNFGIAKETYTPTSIYMGEVDISGTLYRFDYMTLNIKTNEKAICRWSQTPTRFSNMPIGNGLDNLFPNKYQTDHTKTFSGTMVPIGENNLTLYIACTDTNGNENEMPFKIFVGASHTDVVPPSITGTNPRNDARKYSDIGKVDVKIFLNEQVNGCKWSQTDKDYTLMENSFNNCNTFVDGRISCNATLPFNGGVQDNKYYFRCNDTKGNVNNYGYEYVLHPCGAINITSTSPIGTVESCSTLWNVTLSAKTDGGSEEGIATCYYNGGSGILEQFDYTNSQTHSSKLILPAGSYNYPIICIDESGNADQKTINFNIISNLNPPQITRIYNSGNELVIQTSKDAKCYYSKTTPDFTYTDAGVIPFLSNDNLVHKTGWINEVYYVKCQDLCGNGAKTQDIPTTIYPQDFG